MSKASGRQPHHTRALNLALQGGGAHGAFTWGVLDKIFEDGRIWIEAISGTSAGALNAVVAAQGMYDDGGPGARAALETFWRAVSKAGQASLLQRTWLDRLNGSWSLDMSPAYLMFEIFNRVASPYEINPLQINPFRELVAAQIDFEKVHDCKDLPIYISTTNVETGRARIFEREEITLDVLMASACLPQMFHTVMIDGAPYWDGGYMGNPVLFPLIDQSPCGDIAIIQINPTVRPGVPTSARQILDRVNEITFNSSLLKDLWAIDLINRLVADGKLDADKYRRMRIHLIEAQDDMLPLGASSKLNTEWEFLVLLRDIGRRAAGRWIGAHFDDVGKARHSTWARSLQASAQRFTGKQIQSRSKPPRSRALDVARHEIGAPAPAFRAFLRPDPDCGPAADQLQKRTRAPARSAPVAQLDRALPSEGVIFIALIA